MNKKTLIGNNIFIVSSGKEGEWIDVSRNEAVEIIEQALIDFLDCDIFLAKNLAQSTVGNWVTQSCCECGDPLKFHPNPNFRKGPHRIRCSRCASRAEEAGYTEYESYYVM